MWVHSRHWGDPDGGGFSSKTNMCHVVVTLDNQLCQILGSHTHLPPTYFPLLTSQRHPQGESTAQQPHVVS